MRSIALGLVATLFLPFLTSADSVQCPALTKTLSYGSRGAEVIKLQNFLISQNLLAPGSNSGYFGKVTQTAVQQWQKRNGVVSRGTPATTGYGAVGMKTRIAIAKSCTNTVGYTQSAYIPTIPTYSQSSYTSGYAQGTYYSEGTYVTGYTQATYITPPPSYSQGTYYSQGGYTVPPPSYSQGSYYSQGTYTPPPSSSGSMDDYWNSRAYFQLVRKQVFPIEDQNNTLGVGADSQQDIVVVNGVWYRFSREFAVQDGPGCPGSGGLRIVIHKSTDKGATWTNRIVLVDAGGTGPTACQNADGSAFYDSGAATWHYIFQCLGATGGWNVCHASRANPDPIGPFVVDADPVIHGGDIFKMMGHPNVYDEGTPQIVEKIGDKYYVTFHGYDGVRGYRIIAWTRDFHTWGVDTNNYIFSPSDCAWWNVAWQGGCIGSGYARVINDGTAYYMTIEAADGNLACQQNQNWVFGLLRTPNLTSPSWSGTSGGPGIIFNTAQKYPNGSGVECGVQYADFFRDGNDTYIGVWRTGVANGNQDSDPQSGWYLYRLVKGAPLASYSFQFGATPNQYVQSDIVSRGNLEASLSNVTWLSSGVSMNGVNSLIQLPNNPALKRTAPWSLQMTLSVSSLTSSKSSFIGGDTGSAWLELYADGTLCAWAQTTSGPKNACAALSLNTQHTIALILSSGQLTLSLDGTRTNTAVASVPAISTLSIGSSGPNASGFYASWNGTLSNISFFDYAI